jgi:magnesium transporter
VGNAGARWIDLVDPSRDEVLAALPSHADPEVVDVLATPGEPGREPWPVLESHGGYVFGVLVALRAISEHEELVEPQEIDLVATPELLVTVRKSSPAGVAFDPVALHRAAADGARVGTLVHRLVDDVAETYLELLDEIYVEIDRLEDRIDELRPPEVRLRMAVLRHELLYRRRTVAATRAAVRRVLDGRVDVGEHELFPTDVERQFADTYDTLVRVTEDLDIARDLLASVRDHLQAKVAETQNDVGKKLTVIASMVLVPSFIVGFYGQNFEGVFDRDYWTLGVSTALIAVSTFAQLALFRWRRWI